MRSGASAFFCFTQMKSGNEEDVMKTALCGFMRLIEFVDVQILFFYLLPVRIISSENVLSRLQ